MPTHRRSDHLIAALLAAVSALAGFWLYGFAYGIGNNEYHVIIVTRISEGLTWTGDLLEPTIARYSSLLWPLLGHVARVVPERLAYLLFFLLARVLLALGLSSLIRAFAGVSRLQADLAGAVLAILPGFLVGLPLGDDGVFGYYLSQTFVSIGFGLVTLGAVIAGAPILAGLSFAATLASNVMQASFVAALLGGLALQWAFEHRRDRAARRAAAAFLLRFGLAFAPLGLAAVYQLVSGHVGFQPLSPPLEGRALSDFVKYHWPEHHFWSLKHAAQRFEGVSLPLTLAAAGVLYRQRADATGRRASGALFASAAVLLAFVALEAVLGEYFLTRTQVASHWFRSDVVSFCLGAAALTGLLILDVREQQRRWPILALALIAFLHVVFLPAVLLLAAVAIAHTRAPAVGRSRALIEAALVCAFGALALGALRLGGLYATMPAIVMLLGAAIYAAQRIERGSWLVAAVLAALLAFNSVRDRERVVAGGTRYENWRVPQDMRSFGPTVQRLVPATGVLLVPPVLQVRPFFKRPVYLTMKDTAAMLWQPGFETEFLRRLDVLGIEYTPGRLWQGNATEAAFYAHLPASLPRVAREGVTHVVLPRRVMPGGTAGTGCLATSQQYCLATIEAAIAAFTTAPSAPAPAGPEPAS